MLKECRTHGYYRLEECPICGEEGRFLMNEEELDKIGRTMAGVLRHFPDRYGLTMDKHGWVDLSDFIRSIQARQRRFRWLKAHHILAIIDTDPKGRYQFRDGKLRATYAHSVDIELDLPTRNIPDLLYYPTTKEEKDILLETGLLPSDRKKVHLSITVETAIIAGKVRDPNPLIFEVNTKNMVEAEHIIMKAGNTVFIVDEVPPEFLRLMDAKELPEPEESEVLPKEESEVLPEDDKKEETEVLPKEESEVLPKDDKKEETEVLPKEESEVLPKDDKKKKKKVLPKEESEVLPKDDKKKKKKVLPKEESEVLPKDDKKKKKKVLPKEESEVPPKDDEK